VGLLGEAGFADARIVELATADAADADVGSDHLSWLAVTATRRD
jgi:hypothetical protein